MYDSSMMSSFRPFLFIIVGVLLTLSARTTAYRKTSMTMFSRRNRDGRVVDNSSIRDMYRGHLLTVFIVHGLNDGVRTGWMGRMKNAFLDRNDSRIMDDYMIILVDWDSGTSSLDLFAASQRMDDVGADVGAVANKLIRNHGSHASRMYCIGHSLGAHVCAYASETVGGFRRITGLDPAADLGFGHLDRSRAAFVDVIHTSFFGTSSEIGHVDFFVNGGSSQPGCAGGWMEKETCDHVRAIDLYIQSLKRGCFRSRRKECDECPLSNTAIQWMGYGANRNGPYGRFELNTSSNPPFCLP